MWSFSKNDGDGTRTAKKQSVYISKTTTLQVHHPFLYISQPSLQVCDLKLPNFTGRFMELVNKARKFSFPFSQLRSGPFGFNPRQFRQDVSNFNLKMELNKIDEV